MSQNNSFQFIPAERVQLESLTNRRDGEIKLGETIGCGSLSSTTKIVLIGIEESVGPQANLGLKGAEFAFPAFLSRLVNMQDNVFQSGKHLCYLGKIVQQTVPDNVEDMRKSVEQLDELVYTITQPYFSKDLLVIVVGGGHNNAYPLIRAASNSCHSPIDVINLDPHADCRKLEGRHSGNSFSTAYSEGLLKNYIVYGLHKAYNSSFLLNQLEKMNASFTFFEDYLLNDEQFRSDVRKAKESLQQKKHGIELDLDAIGFMPSSAFTPSGFSVEQARWYIRTLTQSTTKYIHLTEGAPLTAHEEKVVGKTLAYLVSDVLQKITSVFPKH